jgi:hypothetical protein
LARCCICAAISTIVAEVSSVELDWVSAPRAIWTVVLEISSAEVATVRLAEVIWVTISLRLFTICLMMCSSQPTSSREALRISTVRSPFATRSASRPSASEGIGDQASQQEGHGDADADGDEDKHEDRPRVSETIWFAAGSFATAPTALSRLRRRARGMR